MSLLSTCRSDQVDFNNYNAQLLDTLSGSDESVIGQSVATSTSSAISFVEEDSSSQSNPLPFKPRSADKSSQTSWRSFNVQSDEVPVNDPELQAVFPSFAEAYNQEESQLQDDLADLDFVDDSDFAILNIDGSVESYGTTDDLEDVMYYEEQEDYDDQAGSDYYSEFNEYDQDLPYPDQNTILSPASGPTTLMLFNIFSPEEVDFLKDLVGEEAIKELKDDVEVEEEEEGKKQQNLEYTTIRSRRPPQFSETSSKNVYPSSQGPVGPASSIRESLEVYDRSEYANSDDLVEEGDKYVIKAHTTGQLKEETATDGKVADERRQKMEALLQKLSERYEKRVEETTTALSLSREDALEEEIRETEAETGRMKVMIENLKYRLAQSRPGINNIDTKDLDEEEPLIERNRLQQDSYIRSTAPPVHLDHFSQMIGEKLRDMNTGIHTLNLDEMLDLDHMQIKPQHEQERKEIIQAPIPPPGASFEYDNQKPKKRNVLHPKLKRQRPEIGKAHIPSINLKSYITPPTETPNKFAIEINSRPIIPRYVDEQIPTPQPFVYPEYDKHPKVETKFLPPRTGPRLKGYQPDPHPMTKELYTYSERPLPPEPNSDRSDKDDQHQFNHHPNEGLPPPPFYADTHKPQDFNPKVGPTQKPPGSDVPPHIDASSMLEHGDQEYNSKYVPSNTYRQPIEPLKKAHGQGDAGSKGEQLKASRTSKEYAPATFTKYPPPSYDYQQPKLRFDATPTKAPYIQVTPKNTPHHTTTTRPADHSSASYHTTTTAFPKPEYVNNLGTVVSKELPPRSYAPPPYRPPSYHSASPEHHSNGLRPEHVSSLSPPARGYAPPVGHKSTIPPPHKPYHTPRPNYMSSIYPPRKGYVPPSSGNFIGTMSPPSHGYSTPLPHVSSIKPPKGEYQAPKYVSTMSPPSKSYSSAKPGSLISTISPPSSGYSTMIPPHEDGYEKSFVSTMRPPQIGYHKAISSHLKSFGKPPSEQYKPPSYMSTMTPPTHGHDHHMHEMKPPSESYEAGMKHHLGKPHTPPAAQNGKYNTPTHAGGLTALQPNYKETMKPPHASYKKGMESIMAKLSVPEQHFLEHAMSGSQSYLPPQKEYLPPSTGTASSKLSSAGKKKTKDYLDTMFKHMHEKLAAPTKGYLPPPTPPKKNTHYEPPKESYMDPITVYMSSMHLPRKGYLPPDDDETYSEMKPPSAAHDKPMTDYLTALKAPESGYLPPSQKKGKYMEPPSAAYEKPITDYLAVMHGPQKGYIPPATLNHMKPPKEDYQNPVSDYMAAMQAPTKNYLPPKPSTGLLPELASYLSPISAYMASMLPPKTEYGPPHHDEMKPPSKDYLPPAGYDVQLKPPSGEYLTPFKPGASRPHGKDPKMIHIQPPSGSYKAPAAAPPPPRPVFNGVCPPPQRNVKCEYVKHQCWSVGTPDVDCPGHGLCCFDGCINSCLPNSPRLPFGPSFHVPPNTAYLVPGQQNLFLLEALASKRRNEEGSDSSTAAQQFIIPPMYSLASLDQGLDQNTKSLPQRPHVSQLPKDKPAANLINLPTDFKAPAQEYLPPSKSGHHPLIPVDGYDLPQYEGSSLEDAALRPSLQYAPPTLDYQLSHEKAHLKQPLKGKPGLTLPSKEYLPPSKMTAYQPPDLSYKAPKSLNLYGPPTKEYLPPDNIMKYKPPAKDYNVPKEMNHYSPPDKKYVAPNLHSHVTTTLKPDFFSRGALDASFRPPSAKYLAPKQPEHKMPMLPPSEEYKAPPHPTPNKEGAHYSPPSKEYIPPSLAVHDPYHHQHQALLTPPKKEYIPPSYAVDHPPVTHAPPYPEGVPFQVPSKEYLPPKSHQSQKEHALMTPPTEEYLTPLKDLPAGEHAVFRPPNKEYLPPASVHGPVDHHHPSSPIHHGSKLVPPTKEYLPPAIDSSTVFPPHSSSGASYAAKFVPPSKEYLAPEHPVHDHVAFRPPSKEYLPPKPIVHPSAPTVVPPPEDPFLLSTTPHNYPPIDVSYKPPSKDYLPPTEYSSSTPHSPDFPTLVPPSKEYLPPPSNAIEEIGHAIHIAEHHHAHVTVPPALLPKHTDDNYHITATLNQGGLLSPHQATVSKVGPHSINIQIHMPDHPKATTTHGTTTERLPPVYYPTTEEAELAKEQSPHKVLPHMLPHGNHDHQHHSVFPHMLPHGESHLGYKSGPPPSLPQYVPPPDSTHADGYGKLPKYLSSDYRKLSIPPKKYLPSYHSIPPKEYLPTNPQLYTSIIRDNKPSYESKDPTSSDLSNTNGFLQPLQTLRPPSAEFHAPIQEEIKAPVRADGYLPPENYTPPTKDYLPPAAADDDETIPAPPNPDELPENIDDGLPSRGPQFPLRQEVVPAKEKDYSSPPPRPNKASRTELQLQIEEILNSQVIPPSRSKEKYIPPMTKFDVPKNFVRPDEIVEGGPIPALDEDPDSEVIDDFGVIDILDEEELPEPPIPETVPEQLTEQPFLGLAKLIDPERKKSLKELEELKAEVKKLAKLVKKPTDDPPFPPIPTVPTLLGSLQKLQKLPPQPSSFVPFIEKFDPSVLQQLQSTITNQGGNRNGKIPGKPGVDYPDFKTIPATDFSCENFILEGFYADTFTSCQVCTAVHISSSDV